MKKIQLQDIAQTFFTTKAIQINAKNLFTFASGIQSPIYCDNRMIIGFVKERELIIQAFLEKMAKIDSVDAVFGVSTAGIPWASFLANQLQKPMGYVRVQKKDHGSKKLIEGFLDIQGKHVIVIEDLITMGNSVFSVIETLMNEGADKVSVLSIFKYGFTLTDERFQKANIPFYSLITLDQLLEEALKSQILSLHEVEIVQKWKNNKQA